MAIKCLECGYVENGTDGLHTVSKCPNKACNNTDRDKFIRIDDVDIDPIKHAKEKEYLESRKI